jgi:branched-chain amino acid transport system permease protein
MLIGIAIYSKIRRSKLGFYLRAIGNEAEAAQSLGINLSKYKLISFMISGALSAIAGTVLAQYTGFAEPNRLFGWEISFGIVVAVILGGGRYVPGPIIGGFAVTFISEMTRKYGGGSAVQGLNMIVYGFVLILVVHFMGRGGICSLLERGR